MPQKKKKLIRKQKVERNWTKIFVSTNPNLVDLFIQLLEEQNIKSVAMNNKNTSYVNYTYSRYTIPVDKVLQIFNKTILILNIRY